MTNFDLIQEAEYVLGMMELYQNDSEISQLLKMKGLNNSQVEEVLHHIKKIGYRKRIMQSYRIALIGFGIAVILGPLWYFMSNSGMHNRNDEVIQRVYSGYIINLIMYGFIAGIIQLAYDVYRFVTYKLKLKTAL